MRYYSNHVKSSYANRGMNLESDINLTNEYYKNINIALIYKKPTPIKISTVSYDTKKITEAFFETQSTLDYNGIYRGKYIEFDAKETISKTSFPLANIHKHQLEHIKGILTLGGIAFLIVRFVVLNKSYVLFANDLLDFISTNSRKSIPINYFEEKGYEIIIKYTPRLDYLKVIDKFLEGTNETFK